MYFDFSILHIILRFIQMSARKKKHYSHRYYGRMMLVSTNDETLWNQLLLNPEAVGKILRLIDKNSPMLVPKNKHQQPQSFLFEVLLSRLFENGVGGRGQNLDIKRCMESVFQRISYRLCDNFHRYLRFSNPYISILGKFLLSPLKTFFFTHPHPRFPSLCDRDMSMDSVCSRLEEFIHSHAIKDLKIHETWCCTPILNPIVYYVKLKPAFDFIKGAMKAAFPGDSFGEMTKKLQDDFTYASIKELVMGYDPIPRVTDDNMYD